MNITFTGKNRSLIVWAFTIPMFFRLVMSTQGIDSTDVGFCNTFYQAIFDAPDSNEFNFIYYLTGFLGGCWEKLFGKFGLMGFRIFELLTLSASVFCLYSIYKDKMVRKLSAAAVFLSLLFPVIIITFHYDTLSYLLVALAALMFSKHTEKHKGYLWITLAGVFIGISFFARIVNLSFCILAILPLLHKGGGWKSSLSMIGGMMLGVCLMIVLMAACGHLSYYMAGLHEAFSTLDRSEATHSKGEMIIRYIKSLKNVIIQIAVLLAITYALYRNSLMTYRYQKWLTYILYATIFTICLTGVYLTTLASSLMIILAVAYNKRHAEDKMKQTTLFLLIATLCFPMGSDIGIQGIFNWCAGLLIFPAIYDSQYFSKKILTKTLRVGYVCITVCAILKIGGNAYNEEETRSKLWSVIQPSRLNVMTDSKKAACYKSAIAAIKKYADKERNLLVTVQASELYYATNMMPYLGHVQTIIYQGSRLERRLEERLAHFCTFPLVATPNLIPKEDYEVANEKIIKTWMRKYHYRRVYHDSYITLYRK